MNLTNPYKLLKRKKRREEMKDHGNAVLKVVLAILGIGFLAGTTLVLVVDRIMKKIFVNVEWPEEEWSNQEWSEEEF